MNKQDIINAIQETRTTSAWDAGVKSYAIELLEELEGEYKYTEAALLNGARNWSEYSYGGCALIYDADICERLCSPSEQKRKDGGRLQPNSRETWLDCQTRALTQASTRIRRVAMRLARGIAA